MRVCPSCRHQFPAGSNFCPHDGHKLEESAQGLSPKDPFIGLVLDSRYKVESLLGSGGMGNVYAARHIVIDKPVAIKILRLEYSKDPRQAERFIREARAASRIGHPNIVDVTDFGRLDNGQIFFVMEYLVGVTLASELRKRGAQSTRRVLNLAIQICRALGAAHAKGIVHRDLKPENIFIVNPITVEEGDDSGRQQDSIKLLDFGIAKITWDEQQRRLTKVGSIFGTPQYMSPEQAAGKDTDLRGDVYALGCIIYEMLTGELPFIADTFMGTLTKQMFENPVPPRQLRPDLRILAPLELLVLQAMEKDPDKRFQTMQELADALEQCYELGEIGPAQRTPVVVLPPEDPAVAAITDKKLETVHLLVKERAEETATPPPGDPGALRDDATDSQPALEAPSRRRQGTWFWAALVFVLLSGGGIYGVLRLTSSSSSKGKGVAILGVDAGRTGGGSLDSPSVRRRDAAAVVAVQPDMATRPDTGSSSAPRRPHLGRVVNVRFRSVPSGAMLVKDGRSVGRCPRSVSVRAGRSSRFMLRLPGYEGRELKIAPRRDEDHIVKLKPLQQGPHKVITTPYGSTKDLRTPSLFKGKALQPKGNP